MLTLGISTRVLSLTEAPSTRKRVGLSIEDTDNVFDKFDSSEATEHDYDELIRLTRGVNTKSARFF
jgi:CBS-domain-containing membrane protein